MNLYVLLKMVPDTVEELNVSADGKTLDSEFLRFKLSEPDEHALEQALILKEKCGGKVTVVTIDSGDVDETLYTAVAKGADRVVKVVGEGLDQGPSNQKLAAVFQNAVRPPLVQASNSTNGTASTISERMSSAAAHKQPATVAAPNATPA